MKNDKFSFIGTTDKVSKAFPGILSLKILLLRILKSTMPNTPVQYYSSDNFSPSVGCLNPRCQQGGLALQNIIAYHNSGEYEFFAREMKEHPKVESKGIHVITLSKYF